MPKVVSANAFLCGKLHDQLHVWKIKLKTTAKQPSVFCGYFLSLIHVKFLYNVNENGRNYEEKNEGGNESAVDGPQRNKEKAGKRNDGLCLKRGSKRACSRKFNLIDEKIKEGCLGTTGERESTKCCRLHRWPQVQQRFTSPWHSFPLTAPFQIEDSASVRRLWAFLIILLVDAYVLFRVIRDQYKS